VEYIVYPRTNTNIFIEVLSGTRTRSHEMLFYWTSSQLSVLTPCDTNAVVPLRRVVGRCGFLAPRVGVYHHQCVGSSGGGLVSVPWF
jgi:hypothetical protein